MTGLRAAIAYRNWAWRVAAAARSLLPRWLGRLIEGPIGLLPIDEVARPTQSVGAFRPVDLLLPEEIILRRRVVVPKTSRKEISHAIELFVVHETPFDLAEVVVHGSEMQHNRADDTIGFEVRVVPRAPVVAALRAMRIGEGRVRRVIAHGDDGEIDLAGAFFPHRRYRRWVVVIPIVIVMVAVGFRLAADLNQRHNVAASLQQQVEELLEDLRTLAAEADALSAASQGTKTVTDLVRKSPSAYTRLEQVRQSLPESTEIARIDLRNGELRLSVRSANALADAQTLGTSDKWSSTIEGAITADPAGDREIAVILLSGGPTR